MRKVLSSATEAKLGAFLFHNGKEAHPLRSTLKEMGHTSQQATHMAIDNNTAIGIATNITVKRERSKVIDMHFIGSATVVAKANFKSIGAKARQSVPTIYPSVIRPRISRPFVPCIFILRYKSYEELF